jgi:hypothetical protein
VATGVIVGAGVEEIRRITLTLPEPELLAYTEPRMRSTSVQIGAPPRSIDAISVPAVGSTMLTVLRWALVNWITGVPMQFPTADPLVGGVGQPSLLVDVEPLGPRPRMGMVRRITLLPKVSVVGVGVAVGVRVVVRATVGVAVAPPGIVGVAVVVAPVSFRLANGMNTLVPSAFGSRLAATSVGTAPCG